MAREHFVLTQRTARHQHNKVLTLAEKNTVYRNLKKRVQKKSSDSYHDKGTEPVGLRLERTGSNLDRQVVYIVQYGTFQVLRNNLGKETGFECLVYVSPGKLKRLCVNLAKFKMYTESAKNYVGTQPQLCWGFFVFLDNISKIHIIFQIFLSKNYETDSKKQNY